MKNLASIICFLLASISMMGQINLSPKEKENNKAMDEDEIVFEDMSIGSSGTNGNKKMNSIKEAFKTFDINQILAHAIPGMEQDKNEIQNVLDSFSLMFNKSSKVHLVESIAATFGDFGYNGRTIFKSNNPTFGTLDIDYSYGRENDPTIYRFTIYHKGKKIATYPRRYHTIDMLLTVMNGINSDSTSQLISANTRLINLSTETSKYPYFKDNPKTISSTHGNLSWYYILEGDYKESLENAKKGLALFPENTWIKTNEAHAYLLNGDLEKAKSIYSQYKDSIIHNDKFNEVCLKDLQKFSERGIAIPNYEEIKSLLSK